MALKDIIGQEKALNILKGSLAKNRIAHAYLFAGEDGIGKRLTAINFAKVLNCKSPHPPFSKGGQGGIISSEEIDCCDKCSSCIKINKAIHPDVFFIKPEGKGGQIAIEMIRELQESLSYKAFEGGWKIVIIDSAESLNQSAANAFLKTLEEPHSRTAIVLVSSMPGIILDTILSRCQRINFSPLPLKKMTELLSQKSEIPNPKSEIISMLSSGSVGQALSEDLVEKRNHSLKDFKSLLTNIEDTIWEDRDSMKEWFEWAELWLRDIAVFKTTGRADFLVNRDKEIEIKGISEASNLRDILVLADRINEIKGLLRFNLNKELTLYYTSLLLRRHLAYT